MRGEIVDYVDGFAERWWDAQGNLVSEREVRSGQRPQGLKTHSDGEPAELQAGSVGRSDRDEAQRCTAEGHYAYWVISGKQLGPRPNNPTYRFRTDVPGTWRGPIERGLSEWVDTRNLCGSPDLIAFTATRGLDTTAGLRVCDGVNAVGMRNMGEAGGTVAKTYPCQSSSTGRLVEADIVFNTFYQFCDGACSGGFDLQGVAAHEWGHFLGLGDLGKTGEDCTAAWDHQVMFCAANGSLNATLDRYLGVGDMEGAHNLYPAGPALYDDQWYGQGLYNDVPGCWSGSGECGRSLSVSHAYDAYVDIQNTGGLPWAIGGRVRLGTSNPLDRASNFSSPDWLSSKRPSLLDENVNVPGKSFVSPGEVGRFSFRWTTTSYFRSDTSCGPYLQSTTGHTCFEYLRPVAEGVTWMRDNGIYFTLNIGTYAAGYSGSFDPPVLVQQLGSSVYVDAKNDGTAPWFIGQGPVEYVTDNPFMHCSDVAGPDWISCSEASFVDQNVTDPGNTRYVAPGQVGRFSFTLFPPLDPFRIGNQHESFVAALVPRDGGPPGPIGAGHEFRWVEAQQ